MSSERVDVKALLLQHTDALLKAMGPKMQRLLLREILVAAANDQSKGVTLFDMLKINGTLLGKRTRGEI